MPSSAGARRVLAEPRGDEGAAQRRSRHALKDGAQHFEHQRELHVAPLAAEPVHREEALGVGLARLHGVGHLPAQGAGKGLLQGYGGVDVAERVALELLGHDLQPALLGIVAPEEEAGVARMVVGGVEFPVGLVGQAGYLGRPAAGVEGVERVGEHGVLALLGEAGVGRGVDALHLVVDHALVGPGAVGGVGFDVPAFLAEAVLGDARVEDGVEVDVDEVVEVLQIGAGHGVAGLVGEGEGVEEGLQGALEEVHEGFLHRILL